MESNFTPGPWESDGVCVVSSEEFIAKVKSDANGVASKRCKANAQLISAAPELLKACLALLGEDMPQGGERGNIDYSTAIKMARAAIAKATGKE